MTRRDCLKAGVSGGAQVVLAGSALGKRKAKPDESKACMAICNHWSYIGIGWQLGIESCVLSATDAIENARRAPHMKTCLNQDARAYEFMAEEFPEVAEQLKECLAAGTVELIGCTYGQPMGTSISGESNIRQMVVGRELVKKLFGYAATTFLEEEEFTHPQIPQLAKLAGYKYASLNQLDTWGRAGCPTRELNAILWKGIDGTTILSTPKNALFSNDPGNADYAKSPAFQKLASLGKPLMLFWEEYGWESPEDPAYLYAAGKYSKLAGIEYVTLTEYLEKYGKGAKETVFFAMDDWDKSLTWGLGGDQVRIMDRKVNELLLGAELFDAVAASLGRPSQHALLELAWRDELASQSHDVGLCEYSRWQQDRFAPYDRIEDKHNMTWGNIGFQHLDAAQKQGQEALDGALTHIRERVNSASAKHGQLAATLFNSKGWERTEMAHTGRVHPVPPKTRGVRVRNAHGEIVPSQIVKSSCDSDGNLKVVEMAFSAQGVPSAGYATFYLDFLKEPSPDQITALRFDESALTLENEFLKVGLDPVTGGVASLVEKATGREMLDSALGAFPRFSGRPNPNLSLRPNPPAMYDSAKSKASIDWLAKGPGFATVRASHQWRYCRFETRVTLAAGSPYVDVVTRTFTQTPPHSDPWPPANIQIGYWLSLKPNFAVNRILRDYPFGVEETKHAMFHGLTFADLIGEDRGLLVLHPGTQLFRREASGEVSNLIMREWESHFTQEYGWPLYAEYRHALMPHSGKIANADRHRAAAAFAQPLICRTGELHSGPLPLSKSFLKVEPAGVQLSAFRKKPGKGYELRVVEVEGARADALVSLGFPVRKAVETDFVGDKLGDAAMAAGGLRVPCEPWKIRTFHME